MNIVKKPIQKIKVTIDIRDAEKVTTDKSAFLSKEGEEERVTGSNWCNGNDCSGDNETVNTYIYSANNSYNKNNETPLYTIKLTPSIIEKIKSDNKEKSYDDYNLTCKNDGTVCISNYLTCLQERGIIQINNSEKRSLFEQSELICK